MEGNETESNRPVETVALGTIACLFGWLGATSFGGPAVHIALMEEEVVRRRRWLTHQEFLDLLGATNLIPGPNSTELAIHIGHKVAGWPGLVVAGVCFILPATFIVLAIAWIYTTFGQLPAVSGVLYGVKPVVIAVVAQALWQLGRKCLTSWLLASVALVATILIVIGGHELAVLFGAGLAVAILRTRMLGTPTPSVFSAMAAPMLPVASAIPATATPFGLLPLFLFFLKVGAVLFGSGYVLLAFLRADLVERHGWLTEQQLLDAVAVGQVTPGPVFTTATFIGFLLGGFEGAALATTGIFLPAFFFVAMSVPFLSRLRSSPTLSAFLDGVNSASLALMAVVAWQLGWTALVDATTVVLALGSAVLLLRYGVNSAWLVLAGAAIGLCLTTVPLLWVNHG